MRAAPGVIAERRDNGSATGQPALAFFDGFGRLGAAVRRWADCFAALVQQADRQCLPALLQAWICGALLLCGAVGSQAARSKGEEFLLPEQAFRPQGSVAAGARSVAVTFAIAPGYYLYRDKIQASASGATLAPTQLPAGAAAFDETFGKTLEVYRGSVQVVIPVQAASAPFALQVGYQGCADKGLCYAPQQWVADVDLRAAGTAQAVRVRAADGEPAAVPDRPAASAEPAAARQEAEASRLPARLAMWALAAAAVGAAWAGLAMRRRRAAGAPRQ